jgi:hypothetical protein
VHRRTDKLRFLFAGNHVDFDAGLSLDAFEEPAAIARFASRRRGDGAIGGDLVVVHGIAKTAEGANRAENRFRVKHAPREGVMTEANGRAFIFQNFDLLRRGGAGDDQTNRVRAGINCG